MDNGSPYRAVITGSSAARAVPAISKHKSYSTRGYLHPWNHPEDSAGTPNSRKLKNEAVLRAHASKGDRDRSEVDGIYNPLNMVSTADILTYSDSGLDIALNYVALFLSLLALALLLSPFDSAKIRFAWVPLFIGLFVFQVSNAEMLLCDICAV
jgi:hypothetical protein